MQGDALLLIVVMVFGCAAFFFGLIYAGFRVLAWIGRALASPFRPFGRRAEGSAASAPVGLVCPRVECRRREPRRDALYCSQCGARLRPPEGTEPPARALHADRRA